MANIIHQLRNGNQVSSHHYDSQLFDSKILTHRNTITGNRCVNFRILSESMILLDGHKIYISSFELYISRSSTKKRFPLVLVTGSQTLAMKKNIFPWNFREQKLDKEASSNDDD